MEFVVIVLALFVVVGDSMTEWRKAMLMKSVGEASQVSVSVRIINHGLTCN